MRKLSPCGARDSSAAASEWRQFKRRFYLMRRLRPADITFLRANGWVHGSPWKDAQHREKGWAKLI
jgi:hypothetical protein